MTTLIDSLFEKDGESYTVRSSFFLEHDGDDYKRSYLEAVKSTLFPEKHNAVITAIDDYLQRLPLVLHSQMGSLIEDPQKKNRERYLKMLESGKLNEHLGKWATFNNDGSSYVYVVASAAIKGAMNDESYVVQVGRVPGDENINAQVLLASNHRPDGDLISKGDREMHKEEQEVQYEYVYKSRRWINVTLKQKDAIPSNTRHDKTTTYKLEIMGVVVRFRESKHCDNMAVRNINLLGTDFLNEFCIIDDYLSGSLRLLKRYVPEGVSI